MTNWLTGGQWCLRCATNCGTNYRYKSDFQLFPPSHQISPTCRLPFFSTVWNEGKKQKKNYVQSTSRLYSGGMKAHVSEWMSSTSGTTGPCLPHHKLWSSFGEQNSRGIMLTHPTAVHCWVWTAGDCVLPQTRQEDKTAGGMVHPSICPPPKQSLYSPQNPIDMSDHNTAHTCMQGCFLLFFFKQSFIQSIYTGCKKMQFTKKDKFFTNSVFKKKPQKHLPPYATHRTDC